jgi:hypothetical protein
LLWSGSYARDEAFFFAADFFPAFAERLDLLAPFAKFASLEFDRMPVGVSPGNASFVVGPDKAWPTRQSDADTLQFNRMSDLTWSPVL